MTATDTCEARQGAPLLHEAVAFHGRFRPSAPAVTDAAGTTTYGELAERMVTIGTVLAERAADRVGILLGNTVSHLELLLAAAAAGATVAPMHPGWGAEKLAQAVHVTGVDLVVTADDGRAALAESGVPGDRVISVDDVVEPRAAGTSLPAVDPEGWHLLAATGGTGGAVKAVAISHRATAARALAQVLAFGVGPRSCFVATTPLYHGAARGSSFAHLLGGGHVVLHDSFEPDQFEAQVASATSTFCVPTMLVKLLDAGVKNVPEHLQIIISGAALDPTLAARADRQLNCTLLNYYASVDAGGIAAAPVDLDGPPTDGTTVGLPFLGSSVQLLDDDGQPVAEGETGRVVVSGASLSSAVISADGDFEPTGMPLATGDLGRFDDAGRLVLTGRADDLIISGGVNVAPEEVEAQLRRHPGVRDVLVAGVPDSTWGQVVGCLVVLEDATIDDVESWAATTLAGPERPRRLHSVAAIPLTPLGKPDRRAAVTVLEDDA